MGYDSIAMSAFVIDVFCLGVKDALFMALPESEYEHRIKCCSAEYRLLCWFLQCSELLKTNKKVDF